jgi:hypothetical protein
LFAVLVLCTQVNKMLVMLLWVYIHTGQAWASIPKVVDSIPTVAMHIFQACPVWIYTQSNITSILLLFAAWETYQKFKKLNIVVINSQVEKYIH